MFKDFICVAITLTVIEPNKIKKAGDSYLRLSLYLYLVIVSLLLQIPAYHCALLLLYRCPVSGTHI